MSKSITDKSRIEEVLTRGVERVYPNEDFLRKLLSSGKRVTVYLGIDPTGPSLHLGHAIPLMKLAQLQALGHKIILLIGDFTALAGDPDKTEVRKRLTKKEILANCKSYKKQAESILKFTGANPAEYRFNSAWLGKLTYADVIELGSHMTVQRLLERDLFQRRIKSGTPLYVHEMQYPLMQGYDSVAMNVDGEVGGNDQTFNMLTGRDLMKDYLKKEKFVIAMKLLEDTHGKKMGKTEGNMVTLTDSPKEMFGKIMSWTDGMIIPGFELCTILPANDIRDRAVRMKSGTLNPRDAKAVLARAIVAQYHGEKQAVAAEQVFVKTFQKHETPHDIQTMTLAIWKSWGPTFVDRLVGARLVTSKSEARRLIEQHGIRVDGTIVSVADRINDHAGMIITVGKRKFLKIV